MYDRDLPIRIGARNRLEAVYDGRRKVGQYEYNALGQRVSKWARYRGPLPAAKDHSWGKPHHWWKQNDWRDRDDDDRGRHGKKRGRYDAYGWWKSRWLRHLDKKRVTERIHFQYDQAGNIIAESDEYGRAIREYIYLGNYRIAMTSKANGFDHGKRRNGGWANKWRWHKHGWRHRERMALFYIHNDHLGTPQKVTDSDQHVVWSVEQTPFGEVELETAAIRMPMRFPGQYADPETGFSYNYFRDYDPSLGRYIQSDPIGLLGGPSGYPYVKQNPIHLTDPNGLLAVDEAAQIGAVVGGAVGGAISGAFKGSKIGSVAGTAVGPLGSTGGAFVGGAIGGAAGVVVGATKAYATVVLIQELGPGPLTSAGTYIVGGAPGLAASVIGPLGEEGKPSGLILGTLAGVAGGSVGGGIEGAAGGFTAGIVAGIVTYTVCAMDEECREEMRGCDD